MTCRNYRRWNEYLPTRKRIILFCIRFLFSVSFFADFLCILYCLRRGKYRSKFDTAKTSHECPERYWYTNILYNIPSIAINNVRMMRLIDIIIHDYYSLSFFFSFPIKINTVTSGDPYNIIHHCGKRWMRFMYIFSVALIHRNLPSACWARQVFFYIFCSALLRFFYKSLTRDIRAMGWAHRALKKFRNPYKFSVELLLWYSGNRLDTHKNKHAPHC